MADSGKALDAADLEDFIASLEDYQTAIPDQVVQHFLNKTGFQTDDVRVIRLVALATQKFIADVAHEALTQRRIHREAQTKGAHPVEEEKIVLTKEDLKGALQEFGIRLSRTEYFADQVSTAGSGSAPGSSTN